MSERTSILDALFTNAERFMAELIAQNSVFCNQEILRCVAQDRQQDYIDLLVSFRNTENRSPFNAAHQEIGGRISSVAEKAGYEHAQDLDRMGEDIFGNPSMEKFYRSKTS